MKTSYQENNQVPKLTVTKSIHKPERTCESKRELSVSSASLSWVSSFGQKLHRTLCHLASLVAPTGPAASLIRKLHSATSGRVILGIILVAVITPLVNFIYIILPGDYQADPSWYFYSFHYYFLAMDDYYSGALLSLGAFLLISGNHSFRYVLAAPFGCYLAQILIKSWADSNEAFLAGVPGYILLLGMVGGLAILYGMDQAVFRLNHGAIITARKNLEGIWSLPDQVMPECEKIKLSRKLAAEAGEGNEIF